MKKSQLKQLIKEIISEVLRQWDAMELEVVVDGHTYIVNANFDWGVESVGHRIEPNMGSGGAGQDRLAEVPQGVKEMEAFDEADRAVVDKVLLAKIKTAVLEKFEESDLGARNHKWGAWR